MNRSKNLIDNTVILFIGNVIPKLANFIILPILTSCLTKAEYGTYDLVTVVCSLLIPFATLQIQTAAFRFLIEYKNDEYEKAKVISNIFIFLLPISLCSLIIMFIILNKYSITTRLLICGYFLFAILYSTCGQIARGLLASKTFASASVICSLSNLLSVFLFVYFLNMGLDGVFGCLLISAALPVCYMFFKINIFKYINLLAFDRKLLKELIAYSWPMVPNAMSMWIMNASDRFVISLFLGIEANAVYAVSKKIPNIITNVQSTFTMAWHESAALAASDSDFNEYYSKMFEVIFSIMAAVMICITICMPILFKILIKGDYREAYYQMPILLLGMFFFSISAYLGGIYTAKKATKSVGITTLVASIINLFTNLLLIKFIGLYAASISTLISYIFLVLFRMYDLNKKYVTLEYNYFKLCLILLALLVTLFLSYSSNVIIYGFELVFAVVVSIMINKKLICDVIDKIKKRDKEKIK